MISVTTLHRLNTFFLSTSIPSASSFYYLYFVFYPLRWWQQWRRCSLLLPTKTRFQCRSLPPSALFLNEEQEIQGQKEKDIRIPVCRRHQSAQKGTWRIPGEKKLFWLNLYVSFLHHFRLQSSVLFLFILSLFLFTLTLLFLFAPSLFPPRFIYPAFWKQRPHRLTPPSLSVWMIHQPMFTENRVVGWLWRFILFSCLIFHTEPFFLSILNWVPRAGKYFKETERKRLSR